jgi:Kelch motif
VRRRSFLATLGTSTAGAGVLGAGCGPLRPFGVPSTAGLWSSRAGLALPRDDFGFAAHGGRLYAVGGMTGARGNALDSVEVYEPRADAWTRGPRLGAPASSLRAATLAGRLYAAGGARDDQEVDLVWTLAPGEPGRPPGAWEPAPPLRRPRLGHGLAALDGLGGRLYAAGGLHGGEALAEVEAFDPRLDRWAPVAPLPEPRYNLALLALGGRLYAVGGSGADRRPSTSVFVYDPGPDRWVPGPALPEPLSNFGAAVYQDRRIHALYHRQHLVYDPRRPRWERARPMPTSRHGLGLLEAGGRLYAVGGCSEEPQRDLADVEVFDPLA